MAPGITGLVGGRPKVSPVIKLFSFLIDKDQLQPSYQLVGTEDTPSVKVEISNSPTDHTSVQVNQFTSLLDVQENDEFLEVPLVQLAVARSGDKGDSCNIGVMARHSDYLPFIEAALTESQIASFMSHVLSERSVVSRFPLPGISAINILMTFALGGGGIASLRTDPQGKAQAQQLLDMPIRIPRRVLEKHLTI